MSEAPHDDSSAEVLRDLLRGAIPVSPTTSASYVTREEFTLSLNAIEAKIETAALKQKLWVLSGVIAIMLAFGGGYISLVGKIDRLTDALPVITETMQQRGQWIQRQEKHDYLQDEALRKVDPSYVGPPYHEPPQ